MNHVSVPLDAAEGLTLRPREPAQPATRGPNDSSQQPTTVILLGNEGRGVPDDAWPLVDEYVSIPMLGSGKSLNVAVAGSLVAYRLAGLA